MPSVLAAIIFAIWGCDPDEGDFDDREDLSMTVISCELAIAKLAECCDDFEPEVHGQCVDHAYQDTGGGCDSVEVDRGHTLPEMTRAESECVRQSTCADLRARGICETVKTNGARGDWEHTYEFAVDHVSEHDAGTFEHLPVCVSP